MRLLRETVIIILLAAVLAFAAGSLHPELNADKLGKLRPFEVTLATALSWRVPILWVDARDPKQFSAGHIPGAVQLNALTWESHLPDLLERWTSHTKIVVYCDSRECDLSAQLAARLHTEAGIPEVYFLHGGWQSWQQAQP